MVRRSTTTFSAMGSFCSSSLCPEFVEMLDAWLHRPRTVRIVNDCHYLYLRAGCGFAVVGHLLMLLFGLQFAPTAGGDVGDVVVWMSGACLVLGVVMMIAFGRHGFSKREMNFAIACFLIRSIFLPIYATANVQRHPHLLETSGPRHNIHDYILSPDHNATFSEHFAAFQNGHTIYCYVNFLAVVFVVVRGFAACSLRSKIQKDYFEKASKRAAEMKEYELEKHLFM